jgi:hypothetical protein
MHSVLMVVVGGAKHNPHVFKERSPGPEPRSAVPGSLVRAVQSTYGEIGAQIERGDERDAALPDTWQGYAKEWQPR